MSNPKEELVVQFDGESPQAWREGLGDPEVPDRDDLRSRVHPDAPLVSAAGPISTLVRVADDGEEDQFRSTTWDFTRDDGTPIDTLAELEGTLGCDPDSSVAADLLRLPFGKAAPAKLIAEARERVES